MPLSVRKMTGYRWKWARYDSPARQMERSANSGARSSARFSKETAEHGHGERLAETPWARQEQGLCALVEDLPDEVRFVDVLHTPLAELAELVDADGDGTQHGCKEGEPPAAAMHKPEISACA
jgi:hypothetical protein